MPEEEFKKLLQTAIHDLDEGVPAHMVQATLLTVLRLSPFKSDDPRLR